MRDDQFHEFNLDGKQLVFLFMSATVVAVVVFLCGVMVGRGVRAPQGEEPQEFAAAVLDPAARLSGESVGDTSPPAVDKPALSYPDRLESARPLPEVLREPGPPPAPAPAPDVTAAPAAPAPRVVPPPPTANPKPPAARGSHYVQAAASTRRADAERTMKDLASRSYPVVIVPADSMFKVRVGPYSKKDADAAVARLRRIKKYKDAWVVP